MYNGKDNDKIENIEIAEQGKYLGMQMTNDKKWYRKHIEERVKKGVKMGNYISTIIGGCCNRLLVGKTIWKNMALPSILYGQELIIYRQADMEKLQRTEYKAIRNVLKLPIYTPQEYLRGEMGVSAAQLRHTCCRRICVVN